MAKSKTSNLNNINFIAPLMLTLYLCIGFIPNWQAVDKIAPQWLVMSILNFGSLIYFFLKRFFLNSFISYTIKSTLNLTYLGFIIWAIGSLFYAINPTEVIVNLGRQFNVFLMFFSMTIFINLIKNKVLFISWIITLIFGVEVYVILNQALEMINANGTIDPGALKGVTANRNITAFSLATKIPFILFLIYTIKITWKKWALATLVTLGLISLSMIQSRASFVAVGVILIAYTFLNIFLYFKVNKKWEQLAQLLFFVIPFLITILVNQALLSNRGADAVSRTASISLSSNDSSINQRFRYYGDVLTHVIANPILGVGLGNWKLKSIDYDAKDIDGYIVPYHAHSDFIQLGAELGILGFLLYLGIFIWALIYVYRLLKNSDLESEKKVFLFLTLTSLGVYSVDANLNFPIARPQVLVVWTLTLASITTFYLNEQKKSLKTRLSKQQTNSFLIMALLLLLPSIYINNSVYKSLKGQMILLQDFNSNQYNLPLNQVENVVPDIPNITVTTIPINSVKARYYVNAKKYDKALALLEKGTKANPYLYYSEILKSQIFQEKGLLDSAKVYARKAFLGLPNNELHSSRYINLINITRDRAALEEAFKPLTAKNKINNWKNYLIVASGFYPLNDKNLTERAKLATKLFPNNEEIKALYRQIAVGQLGVNAAASFSAKGLDFFNAQNYKNAAIEFEKALEANPLDYAHFENAATANYMIGDLQKAEQQIDVVINDLNPFNGKCEYIKALIFIKMGDPIGACPFLAISRDSGFSQAAGTFDQYCR
mgnify:FL=1